MDAQNQSVAVNLKDEAIQSEVERLSKERAAWLDRLAKFYFPDHIYMLGKTRKRLKYVSEWMAAQGYELREFPENMLTQFCRTIDGELTVLAEFQVELRG